MTRKGALCVVVRPSSGHPGKEVPVMDLGIAYSGIVPAVLSSHLDSNKRTFTQAPLADLVRSEKLGSDGITRLVVCARSDGKLELYAAKDGNTDEVLKFQELDDALMDINRRVLRPQDARDAPPLLTTRTTSFDDVELDAFVVWAVARQYRKELGGVADSEQIERDLSASPPPARVEELTNDHSQRVAMAFQTLGITPPSHPLSCSLPWFAELVAAVTDIPRWGYVIAEALAAFPVSLFKIVEALIGWFEAIHANDNQVLGGLASELGDLQPAERTARIALALRTASQSAVAASPGQGAPRRQPGVEATDSTTPSAGAVRPPAPARSGAGSSRDPVADPPQTPAPFASPADAGPPAGAAHTPPFLGGTTLRITGQDVHAERARAPTTADTAPAAAPAWGSGPPPVPHGHFVCPLLERFTPHPSPASASEWLRNIGGDAAAGMLARAAGCSAASIVSASSERGALVAIKHLRSIAATELVGSFGAAPSALVTSDELWQGLRPRDWEDAAARAQEVTQAADVRRSNLHGAAAYPGAMHAAHAGPLFAHAPPHPAPLAAAAPADAAALGAALKAAVEASATRRPGEVKPALATTAQKDARTVCSSEVLEPLTDSKLIEAERALGPLSKRGGDIKAELRRTRALDQQQSHGAAAFIVSCGSRLDDTAGGVPTSINQLRQATQAALRDTGEVARGGPNRREIDAAGLKAIHAATDSVLTGQVEFAQFVTLFGGKTPAQAIETMGSAGAGRDGSTTTRTDIEKALRFWARLVARAHGLLFGLQTGQSGDFGISEFITEAEHMTPARIMRACTEAFEILRRQFVYFRSSLAAPPPDPLGAFSGAAVTALKPLQHEQLTATIATTAAAAAIAEASAKAASAQARGSAAQDKIIASLEAKLREATSQLAKRPRPRAGDDGAPPWPSLHAPRLTVHAPRPRVAPHGPHSTIHGPCSTRHGPRSTFHGPRPTFHGPRSSVHGPRSTAHVPRSTAHVPRSTAHAPRSTHTAPQAIAATRAAAWLRGFASRTWATSPASRGSSSSRRSSSSSSISSSSASRN